MNERTSYWEKLLFEATERQRLYIESQAQAASKGATWDAPVSPTGLSAAEKSHAERVLARRGR